MIPVQEFRPSIGSGDEISVEARSMRIRGIGDPETPPTWPGAILIALATGAPFGCTREFFREWANQDVSEAVFEKTRDPRWRMDLFSVEPPMLSRFADPYDQDVPPAPPDDPAAEALSPVPQWPDNRLLMPVEGTGYLDLLEYWRRDQAAKAAAAGHPFPADEPEYWQRPDNGRHPVTDPRQPGEPGQPLTSPAGPTRAAETGSPFTAAAVTATGPGHPRPERRHRRAGGLSTGPALEQAPAGRQRATSTPSSTPGLVARMQDAGPSDPPNPGKRSVHRSRIRPFDRDFRDNDAPFDAHTSIDRGRSGSGTQDSAAPVGGVFAKTRSLERKR